MQNQMLSILMVGRIYEQQQVFQAIEQAISIISQLAEAFYYFTDARTKSKILAKHQKLTCLEFVPSQHNDLITFIITIGGDGTILYAAKQFKIKIPPIITFQRGSLGFMCRFSLVQMEEVLQKTVKYYQKEIDLPFEESHRMRLQAIKINVRQEEQSQSMKVCINEVYISRRGHERITLEIKVDGQIFTKTAGDGLLISTPTGSTAYSLSAGGPILDNGVNGILIVPISPNSLSFRPICLPSTATITVKLDKSSRSEAYISYDGQSIQQLSFVHELVISKAEHDITFFEPRKDEAKLPSWIQRLKYFLGWNQKYKAPIHYSPQKNVLKGCPNDDK